jgi:hypothetical protein
VGSLGVHGSLTSVLCCKSIGRFHLFGNCGIGGAASCMLCLLPESEDGNLICPCQLLLYREHYCILLFCANTGTQNLHLRENALKVLHGVHHWHAATRICHNISDGSILSI